ncbi:MAG TPA: hypothetical protein VNS09_22205 [Solirubrobacter sp.]|nr:hypothetical protein [Solirubrobacter sp.]
MLQVAEAGAGNAPADVASAREGVVMKVRRWMQGALIAALATGGAAPAHAAPVDPVQMTASPAAVAAKPKPVPKKRAIPKRCRKQIVTKVKGRWSCPRVKVPASHVADDGLLGRRAASLKVPVRTKRGRHVSRKLERLGRQARSVKMARSLARAERRVLAGEVPRTGKAGRARAAEATSFDFTQDGARVTGSATRGELEADQVGQAKDLTAEVTKTVKGSQIGVKDERREHTRVAACPDERGIVTGPIDRQRGLTFSGSAKGVGSFSARVETRSRGSVTARVGDDGALRDFDLDFDVRVHAQVVVRDPAGRIVETSPPDVLTLRWSGSRLKVGAKEPLDVGHIRGTVPGLVKVFGTWIVTTDEVDPTLRLSALEMLLVRSEVEQLLTEAERGWQSGHCLAVSLEAAPARLAAGQGSKLTLRVTPRNGAKGLAPGRFTVERLRGELAPAAGGYGAAPVELAYTAPAARGWGSDWVGAKVTSRQGSASTAKTLEEETERYALVYRHASAVDDAFSLAPYVLRTEGTQAEHRDIGLTAYVPLDESGAGSAPLTWTRSDWSTDTVETGPMIAGSSVSCTIRYRSTVTAGHPGRLDVSGLRVTGAGAVTGSVTLRGVGETWSTDRTVQAGPCGEYDSTQEDAAFLESTRWARGAPVTWTGGERQLTLSLGSGWRPGTGDVVAELSLGGPAVMVARTQGVSGTQADIFQVVRVPAG